jgi:hypothetical protein
MTDSKVDTKSLEAKCLCGSVHFTIDVPVASLPLEEYICHCSVCRYTSGGPFNIHARVEPGIKPNFIAPSSEKNLTTYSIEGFECTYDFCSTCGCHIAGVGLDREEWTPTTSIFTDHSPDTFLLKGHHFSDSALDKGVAQVLTHVDGRQLRDWNPPKDSPRAKTVEPKPEVGEDGQERLRAECHCGGVSFTIKRPSPELLENEMMASCISPVDEKKWMACYDCCDDCRLSVGTHFIGWIFVPLPHLEPEIKSDLKIGTAKTYASSPGVVRSFCGTCGASVFYSHDLRKNLQPGNWHIVDLATGILRAPEGSMAENWLTWRSRLAWTESGKRFDAPFFNGLEEGMKKYVVDKVGRELTASIAE